MHLEHPDILGWGFFVRLAVGAILGFAIGIEREVRARAAGLQTSGLVAVASTLFAAIAPSFGVDKDLRVVANIVTGVGFLAGGVILRNGASVTGLNTAATIWAAAAIGALAGIGLLLEAAIGTFVILLLNISVGTVVRLIDARLGRHE